MKYIFLNLDNSTRMIMLQEYQNDLNNQNTYQSVIMNSEGLIQYPNLFEDAIKNGDEESLNNSLTMNLFKLKDKANRSITEKSKKTLPATEFNRYYMRALIVRSLEEGYDLEIYRAKDSITPRRSSMYAVGTIIRDEKTKIEILEMLRNSENCFAMAERVLFQPNSGLSLKLVPKERQTA